MESVRLTQALRDQITRNLIGDTFQKRLEALKTDREAFGKALYESLFSASDRQRLVRLPDGYVPEVNSIAVRFTDLDNYAHVPVETPVRMPVKKSNVCLAVYDSDTEEWKTYKRLHDTEKAIRADEKALRADISAILHSCTTTARLLEAWPEVECALPTPKSPAPVPAVQTASLNATLGLPKTPECVG